MSKFTGKLWFYFFLLIYIKAMTFLVFREKLFREKQYAFMSLSAFTQQANSAMRLDENGNTNTVQRQKTLESGKNQTLAPTNSSMNSNDGSLQTGTQGEMNNNGKISILNAK